MHTIIFQYFIYLNFYLYIIYFIYTLRFIIIGTTESSAESRLFLMNVPGH